MLRRPRAEAKGVTPWRYPARYPNLETELQTEADAGLDLEVVELHPRSRPSGTGPYVHLVFGPTGKPTPAPTLKPNLPSLSLVSPRTESLTFTEICSRPAPA